jgi:small subunit ribosomal protein S8
MSTKTIDFLTRLRNAHIRGNTYLTLTSTKMTRTVASLLVRDGYLNQSETVDGVLQISFNGNAFSTIEALSKPGTRTYVQKDSIPQPLNGMGTVYISTSQGIMNGKDAAKRCIGGELIFWIF